MKTRRGHYSMGPQEDYIETVFTCEGDFDDPHLQDRLDDFQSSLKDLLLTDKNKLILKKVEPWNSVRVTFNIPREAAARLKQLAQQGNATLRDLGVLAVTILDQHISLTIAGRNNERTHLVFKTADTATGSSVSVFDSQSPSLDVLRPPGPGPSNVEATRKNIQDYLKGSLIDSLFGQADGEKARHPGEFNSRPNNIYPGHLGDPFHSINPATTSPSTSCHSPSRSPGASSGPVLPPGLPPGLPFGPANSIAGLPPPPPYPQGSTYINNLQKLRLGSTSASPLLVNLLQNDPGLSSLLASGKIPPIDPDALQPPKKKRKPRKPREKKPKPGSEGDFSVKNVPNPVLSSSTSQYSSASAMYTQSVKDHNSLQHSQAMHNTSVQKICDDRVPLTCEQSSVRKVEAEPESTAGKIINPVTGLLEPIENLSDTSPEKVSPKSIGTRPPSGKAGDIISNLITTHIKSENQDTNFGNQRTYSVELSPSHKAAVGRVSQWSEKSSQFSGSASSDSIEQKREAIRQEFINMIHKEKSKDIRKTEKSGQHHLPPKVREHPAVSDGKQTVPSLGHITAQRVEKVSLPQEREVKSIPSQLLNKPLLEVKHNSVNNPTGSPDSNGDSECSSQGIGIEPHLGQEPSSVSVVTHVDPHLKSYNNDSGVGSSSERSEDPSEPGDNDYKGTQSSNSFECAKSQLLDPLKQRPPSSNAMTVAHTTMTDIQKDLKNHKILSSYVSPEALINTKIDPFSSKSERLMNDQTLFNKGVKDHLHMLNSVEPHKTPQVSDSMNRKSPKLAATSPKLSGLGQEGQIKGQGNPENPPTQKKKYSPRNSPRGSPRPRASNSPRNTGSPRSSEFAPGSVGSRMPFLTAQDFAAHLPVRSESHFGLQRSEQVKSPYSEQRKSPFAQSQIPPYSNPSLLRAHHPGFLGVDIENRRDLSHGGSVDMARISPQCNIDNVAMLKSLEAYHNPHTQLHLAALAGTKDPVALQRKLEELRPIFQQLQQQAAQAHLIVPPATNGTDQPHSPSRSPVAIHPNGQVPASADLHGALDISIQRGNSHPYVASVSVATVPNDSAVNCVGNRLSKTVDELKGTNATGGARRSSPGAANTVPFSYASSLPLPKRLTESVQKLVKPLPLDNSLPHQKGRSPSSSASTVKQGYSSNNSSGKANVRNYSSGHKTPVNDTSHLDIDSITPSITGFCFDGPLDLGHSLPQISSPSLNEELGPPPLQLTDSSFSAGAILGSMPHASTSLVPAVTSTILSHKTYNSNTPMATNSAFVSTNTLPGSGLLPNRVPVSSAITSANVSTTVSVCNSEVKMANLSAKEQTIVTKPGLNSTGLGPPILHPYNARYPLLKHEEKPKSPYQQMGLSEMLQETANLQSVTAERLPAHTSVSQKTASNSQLYINSALNQERCPVDENSELPIPPVLSRQNSSTSDSKVTNCDSSISIREINETPSISRITSDNLVGNSSATSSLHIPVSESSTNKISTNPVKNTYVETTASLGPVIESIPVSVSCRTETCTTAEVADNKAIEPVELVETSQSKSDLPAKGHCDKMEDVETDCDKVSFESVAGTEVGRSTMSCVSGAAAANTAASSVSLDSGTKETSISEVSEIPENCESSRSTKVRYRSQTSADESHEERAESGEVDSAPRQLRSRKRTNTGESDGSTDEPCKKAKLETSSSVVLNSSESKQWDDSNTQTLIDTVKSGLRARTNIKLEEKDKEKEKIKMVPGKDSKKDVKTATKTVPEKKFEPAKPEEVRRNSQSRRSRQSPSTVLEKPQNATGNRDKSPVRSRARGRNSPVVVEQHEDTQENKRTTRSAKTKVESQTVEPAPVNKRRRTSRDHR